MIKDKYLSCEHVAKLLGFSTDHVRRMCKMGQISAEKIGTVWFILPRAIKGIARQRPVRKSKDA